MNQRTAQLRALLHAPGQLPRHAIPEIRQADRFEEFVRALPLVG
jgi:hypothetical protein